MADPEKVVYTAKCGTCGGTGLFQGAVERADEAVICRGCEGSGGITRSYIPFEGRRHAEDIRTVLTARGDALGGGQPREGAKVLTYQEFLDTVPATPAPLRR